MAVGVSIPGTYKVGGRHMTEPTGPARDSSLQDRKAPGNVTPDAPRSPAPAM